MAKGPEIAPGQGPAKARETADIRISAPAKLNLGLRVIGRRQDGYHLLESLFVPLDLADRLEVRFGEASEPPLRPEIHFEVEWESGADPDANVPLGEGNIALLAARKFFDRASISASIRVRLHKAIPSGAGLGGGSSDAAAVLRVLSDRYPDALDFAELSTLALSLGADVPFFLAPGAARVAGIGEQVVRIPGLSGLGLLLANPGVSLATSDVFRTYDRLAPALTPGESGSTMRSLDSLVLGVQAPEIQLKRLFGLLDSGLLENDLEVAACELCPAVGDLRERLLGLGARWTGMSGSGATVYGIFADIAAAQAALEQAGFEAPVWACAARTV